MLRIAGRRDPMAPLVRLVTASCKNPSCGSGTMRATARSSGSGHDRCRWRQATARRLVAGAMTVSVL